LLPLFGSPPKRFFKLFYFTFFISKQKSFVSQQKKKVAYIHFQIGLFPSFWFKVFVSFPLLGFFLHRFAFVSLFAVKLRCETSKNSPVCTSKQKDFRFYFSWFALKPKTEQLNVKCPAYNATDALFRNYTLVQ
jgi:hypothetical protein